MRRDRSTIFRLTEAEYAQLEAAARAAGARSVSDYIRGAVLAQMAGGTLTERVEAIERRLGIGVRLAATGD